MSVNSHMGRTLSRRDDLESLAYMLVYLARGSLPWQSLAPTSRKNKDKYRRIKTAKLRYSPEHLCQVQCGIYSIILYDEYFYSGPTTAIQGVFTLQ